MKHKYYVEMIDEKNIWMQMEVNRGENYKGK